MVKRICKKCGAEWYSAAAESIWICDNCGAEIPVPEPRCKSAQERHVEDLAETDQAEVE